MKEIFSSKETFLWYRRIALQGHLPVSSKITGLKQLNFGLKKKIKGETVAIERRFHEILDM